MALARAHAHLAEGWRYSAVTNPRSCAMTLSELSACRGDQQQPERAARLLGAAAALTERPMRWWAERCRINEQSLTRFGT